MLRDAQLIKLDRVLHEQLPTIYAYVDSMLGVFVNASYYGMYNQLTDHREVYNNFVELTSHVVDAASEDLQHQPELLGQLEAEYMSWRFQSILADGAELYVDMMQKIHGARGVSDDYWCGDVIEDMKLLHPTGLFSIQLHQPAGRE